MQEDTEAGGEAQCAPSLSSPINWVLCCYLCPEINLVVAGSQFLGQSLVDQPKRPSFCLSVPTSWKTSDEPVCSLIYRVTRTVPSQNAGLIPSVGDWAICCGLPLLS